MRKYLSLLLTVLMVCAPLWSQTYYVDYSSGSDSNNGTSKSTPWKNIPGSPLFSGTYTPATDTYILKGGVTWPNAEFPISASNPNVTMGGEDQTWYTGASWSLPKFNPGGTQIAGPYNSVVNASADQLTFDRIEWTGIYWDNTGSSTVQGICMGAANIHVNATRNYVHGWSHGTAAGTADEFSWLNSTPGNGIVITASYNRMDGSDSTNGGDSGSFGYAIYQADHNIVTNVTNALLIGSFGGSTGVNGGSAFSNVAGPVNASFSAGTHENCIETNDGSFVYVYNNYLSNCTAVTILAPGAGSPQTAWIWGNVVYNTSANDPTYNGFPSGIGFDNYPPSSGIVQYAFFNTTTQGNQLLTACLTANQQTRSGTGNTNTLEAADNACYSSVGTFLTQGSPNPTNYVNTNNTLMTYVAATTTAGMSASQSLPFSPTSNNCGGASGCPVAAGTQVCGVYITCTGVFASMLKTTPPPCTVDATFVNVVTCYDSMAQTRPTSGAVDAGAYCYACNTSQVATPAISPSAGQYVSPQTVSISDSTSGATICFTTDGTTPNASVGTCTHGTTYSTSFSQSIPATVTAIGSKSGYTNSSAAANAYTLPSQVSTPSISPAAGQYTSPQTITISDSTSGATICYTVDGTTPTANGAGSCTHGTTYSGAFGQSIPATVKAIGSKSGDSDSAVASAAYSLPAVTVTPPLFLKATAQ